MPFGPGIGIAWGSGGLARQIRPPPGLPFSAIWMAEKEQLEQVMAGFQGAKVVRAMIAPMPPDIASRQAQPSAVRARDQNCSRARRSSQPVRLGMSSI